MRGAKAGAERSQGNCLGAGRSDISAQRSAAVRTPAGLSAVPKGKWMCVWRDVRRKVTARPDDCGAAPGHRQLDNY